jgi:molybdopterin/thiamine biosynthesis adenylyltransferase
VRFADGGQFVASDAQQAHQYLNDNQHSGGWVANITLKWPWVAAAFVDTAAAVTVFIHMVSPCWRASVRRMYL